MNKHYFGILMVLISAISMGTLPIFSLYAYQGNASVHTVLFLRFSIAAIILFVYSAITIDKAVITRSYLLSVLVIGGLIYTIQSNLYLSSFKYIPASLASLFFYSYPIFVAFLSILVEKEKFGRKMAAAIIISLLGLTLVLGTSLQSLNIMGVLLALGTGLVYSIYIIMSKHALQNASPALTSAFVSFFAASSLLILGLFNGTLQFTFSSSAWWPILGTSFFATVIGILALYKGIELLGSTRASVLSMVEPLATIAFATVLFHEHLGLIQLAGGLLVLLGAIGVNISNSNLTVEPRSQEDDSKPLKNTY